MAPDTYSRGDNLSLLSNAIAGNEITNGNFVSFENANSTFFS